MTTTIQAAAAPELPPVAPETLNEARRAVAGMLSQSDAFRAQAPAVREQIAGDTARIAAVLAEPRAQATDQAMAGGAQQDGKFVAQAAHQGAQVAGEFMAAVDFPTFVAKLVEGVFHAIVHSSIEQMQAYGELVANVAKSLNQFRDENVSENQGRDYLVQQFPEAFHIAIDVGDDGVQQPRVRVREDVDEGAVLRKINGSLTLDRPVTSLDDDAAEGQLVPAARTQLASSRQQLLATMVLMGINRIVVTDGKIQAKVMYDFRARDTFHHQLNATTYDYDKSAMRYTSQGEYDSGSDGGETSGKQGSDSYDKRDGSWYAKGKYASVAEPLMTLQSVTADTSDASLTTKASLAGTVDINFKSDYLPLEKMADSFQIAQLQQASKPPSKAPAPGAAPPAGQQPAAQTPAAQTPAAQPPARA
jgi:hypothetical protein